MPQVKQYKLSVKRFLHFMSQMILESRTMFTVLLCYIIGYQFGIQTRQDFCASQFKSVLMWLIITLGNVNLVTESFKVSEKFKEKITRDKAFKMFADCSSNSHSDVDVFRILQWNQLSQSKYKGRT
jgi:hypothetical protein